MDSLPALRARVERIAVVGLGNVGRLIADMLVERGFEVREVDADESRVTGERASVMDVSDAAALEKVVAGVDAVICCLPYGYGQFSQAPGNVLLAFKPKGK